MTSSSAVDAPWHDLCLYKDLVTYAQVNPSVSSSALKALNRHLWYLCSEMVPLVLFSDIVPKEEIKYVAERLLMVRPADDVTIPHNRFGTGLGKPKFPTIISTSRLGDLINDDSWFIFSLLEMDTEFLNHDVQAWLG